MSSRKPSKSALSLKQQAYIEVIGELTQRHGHAHVSEVARELAVSKPSVVQMLGRLSAAGMVKRDAREVILSSAGQRIVTELGDRQELLQDFMVNDLGMDRRAAAVDACRMEHIVSPAFVRSLRRYKSRRAQDGV